MKRLMFVICTDHDGEGWKNTGQHADPDALREQIRQQLREEVPVVVLPGGLSLFTIELGEAEPEPVSPIMRPI